MSKVITVDTEEVVADHNPPQNPDFSLFQAFLAQKKVQFLAKNTNFDAPLFNVVTSDVFEDYARTWLRSDFKKVSKNVLRREVVDVYHNLKKEVKEMFEDFERRLVVTCDLWTSFGGDDRFVCVTCHWINDDWRLEKYIIGFEVVYPFDYVDIAAKMMEVLDEFGLMGKVGLISYNDGISKEKCMEHLVDDLDPLVKLLSHDRTFASAVDLCGQEAMDQLAPFLDPIREMFKWFRYNPDKKKEYRALCRSKGSRPSRFSLDSSKGWTFKYERLDDLDCNNEFMTKVYNGCQDHSPILRSHWDDLCDALAFVEYFEHVASRFSWSHDVNCHLVIHDCVKIVHGLKSFDKYPRFCSIARNIMRKWLELFPEIPMIYCIGTILDPRFKVEGLRQLLVYYYETLGVEYNVDEKVADCKNALRQLHAHYASASKSEEEEIGPSFELDVFLNVLKRKKVADQEFSGDLSEYLFFDFEFSADDKDQWFEIFQWWRKKEELFPVLSKIAKDVLCTPMSTSIPKSDSCPGKRVLDEKRSSLPLDLIPVCICKTDWDLADAGRRTDDPDYLRLSSDSETD